MNILYLMITEPLFLLVRLDLSSIYNCKQAKASVLMKDCKETQRMTRTTVLLKEVLNDFVKGSPPERVIYVKTELIFLVFFFLLVKQ
jgi:hypothetical protein